MAYWASGGRALSLESRAKDVPVRPITDKQRGIALEQLAEGWSWGYAAQKAGISRRTLWLERQRNEDFALAAEAAIERGTDMVADVVRDIALGKIPGDMVQLKACQFMLAARRPEVWAITRQIKHSGKVETIIPREALRLAAEKDPDAMERAAAALADSGFGAETERELVPA